MRKTAKALANNKAIEAGAQIFSTHSASIVEVLKNNRDVKIAIKRLSTT